MPNTLKIFIIVLLVIFLGLNFYLDYNNRAFDDKGIQSDKQNSEETKLLNNKLSTNNPIPDHLLEEDLSHYSGQIIRLGGHGSFIDQKTAWLLTTGYGNLKPAENWINIIYNRPGDLIHVGCREGYKIIFCKIDGEDQKIETDKLFSCSGFLKNSYRNDILIECEKEELVELYAKLKHFTSSGGMKFYYYDIDKGKVINNSDGNAWFWGGVFTDEESIDNFVNYIL